MEPRLVKLASWYRLLLLAFPRHYRRARGEEMLGTLLDSARPDQARPSCRDAASVISSGFRCRVRIRPGLGTLLSATAAALAGAILTATFSAWVVWTLTAPPLPSQQEAAAIARSLISLEPTEQHRYDFVFGDDGYDAGSAGRIEYRYDGVTESMLASARETLRTNGWTVSGRTATRGGILVSLDQTGLWITRAEPAPVPWLTVIGAIFGMFSSWILAARVSRRIASRNVASLAATIALTTTGFLAIFPACLYSAVQLWQGYTYGAPWIFVYWEPLRAATLIGLLCGAAVIALSQAQVRKSSFPVAR